MTRMIPLIERSERIIWLRYARDCVVHHPQYLAWLQDLRQYDRDDPNFSQHRQWHNRYHTERAIKIAHQFLDNYAEANDYYDPEEPKLLAEIALRLHDVPLLCGDTVLKQTAEIRQLLREFPILTCEDILSISDAIVVSYGRANIRTPLQAAVTLGENLDIFYPRMFGPYHAGPDELRLLRDPYRPLAYISHAGLRINSYVNGNLVKGFARTGKLTWYLGEHGSSIDRDERIHAVEQATTKLDAFWLVRRVVMEFLQMSDFEFNVV